MLVASTFAGASTSAELKQVLLRWAKRYTPDDTIAERIAQRAALVATADAEIPFDPDLERQLFTVLHAVALDELGLTGCGAAG
ncbi:hypothetical protein ABID21_001355 [Pseudorhizobium tarimense]|uniref:Uncharacterized protein n=1 Tax=Pseudorhizobium tarimense TaxID=1079109 RepID=A0ABV2H3Y7_9HYPH|nr:hypothetical protein [Pseudorhizobium tarimense]MCJ8518334.1 hypothetical protein [Pseudorhizobium tarimense]